ncbi:neurofilament heavy polypeptide-like [Salvia divinorum]|uniref:Neurofilament heavy polypeptide-like n=1 Tax=Salvia divinorum TaxID=28513 RepID=A0ABD1HLQ9_SALDI
MATRRRDAVPGKEKATTPSPKAGIAKLRGVVNQISPKPKASTAAQKQTGLVAPRAPATTGVSKAASGVFKPRTRKPPSPATESKPAQTRARSLDSKATTPTHKTRVPTVVAAAAAAATGAARRASSRLVKAMVSPKVAAPAKKWKPVEKEEGKRRLSSSSSVGSGRRSSIGSKKESDRNEDLSICSLPEPEMQLQDIECSYLNKAEGIDDSVREDPTVVIAGSSTVSGQKESPANNKTQESEHKMNGTNSCNKVEKIEDNSHEKTKEKEVKVAPEEQAAVAVESKETEPAVEKKQEKTHGKYDSPVSNDVIEETANKLRENRANKVKALAGAFETVISLQEK